MWRVEFLTGTARKVNSGVFEMHTYADVYLERSDIWNAKRKYIGTIEKEIVRLVKVRTLNNFKRMKKYLNKYDVLHLIINTS